MLRLDDSLVVPLEKSCARVGAFLRPLQRFVRYLVTRHREDTSCSEDDHGTARDEEKSCRVNSKGIGGAAMCQRNQ